jgi:2-polyprenyl-3-methyl-5-hydroxy-6-metoxy-1,4-benzoquinol methylase
MADKSTVTEVKKLLRIANTLRRSGKLEDAVSKYCDAIDLYPNFAWLHYQLGDTLVNLGRWDDAVNSLCQAIELKPHLRVFQQRLESLSGDFDEGLYLQINEDVRIAVEDGLYKSGYHHWLKYGRNEERLGNRPRYSKQINQAQSNNQRSLNVQSLYDSNYYKYDFGGPQYCHGEPHFEHFFEEIAQSIILQLRPKTVLDVGCGIGFLVKKLRKVGVKAFGFDVSKYAISQVPSEIQPYCWVGLATDDFSENYDLITCIEVVEHLPFVESMKAIENICSKTDVILFSSSPFDYREPTHFNVQPPEIWASQFAKYSFFRDLDFNASFIAPWAVLYRKVNPKDIDKIVKNYERKLWLLGQENFALRASVIDLQKSLSR